MTTTADAPMTSTSKSWTQRLEPLIWILAIVALLFVFGKATLDDPTQTAATRDPAWYTWRSGLIVHSDDPGQIAGEWGPFAMFSGGYRVSVPIAGALLQNVAGTQQITFPGFLMVGIPILAGLAFAAAAWRSTKDPFLSIITMFVTGLFFLTTPYVGYLDNLFVLFILGSLIAFLEPARTSWGARSALFMLALMAMFTHPTTVVVFIGTLFAVVGFHLLTMGFKIRRVLDRDLPALLAVLAGIILGVVYWVAGGLIGWGHSGNLIDAALPPPYEKVFFVERLFEWIGTQFWMITVPLMIVAICWIALQAFKDGSEADPYRTMSAWWLLPYAATALTYFMGKALPYYRFMNATAAIMPLTAIGVWAIARWILKKTNKGAAVHLVSWVVVVGLLGFIFVQAVGAGWTATKWNDPANQWVDQDTRASIAAVAAVAATDEDRPIVFVNNYNRKFQAYGWSKTYSNAARSALPAGVGPRTFQYFGDLENFLQNEGDGIGSRTITAESCNEILEADEVDLTLVSGGKLKDENGIVIRDEDGIAKKTPVRPECTYDLVSRGFLDAMNEGVESHGGEPFAFMIRGFNGEPGNDSLNLRYWDDDASSLPGAEALVPIGENAFLIQAPGLATVTPETIEAATSAGEAEAAALVQQKADGAFGNPAHIVRVLLGLIVLLVIPGLIAANWFGLTSWQLKLGLVPVVSISMNILWAFLVISVTRSAFTVTNAWIAMALSIATAIALHLIARRRGADDPGALGGVGASIHRLATKSGDVIEDLGIPFRRKAFKSLMLTQFFSQMGDGVIQGTVAFKLLSPTEGRSAVAVLGIVFLTYLPFAFIAPVLGVISDRYERQRLLAFANIARVVLVLLMAVLLFIGADGDGILILLLLLVLGGARLVLLVKGAGLADAAGGKDLLLANSLSQMGGAIFQVAGFAVALVVATVIPVEGVTVAVGALVYLIAFAYSRGVTRMEVVAVEGSIGDALRGLWGKIVSGVKEVAGHPPAAVGILSFWLVRSLIFGFFVLLSAFEIAAFLKADPNAVVAPDRLDTIISAFFGVIGAVISLFLVRRLEDRVAPAKVIRRSMYLAGAFGILVPIGDSVGVGLVAKSLSALFAGIAFFLVKVTADTLTQRSLPDNFRGRAYALFDISYALSYAVPAGILFLLVMLDAPLELGIAMWSLLVILAAYFLVNWGKRSPLMSQSSDDLSEAELATGAADALEVSAPSSE